MPAPRSHRRARLAALVSVVLAVTGFQFFLAPTAQAVSTGLVINEVYVNGGSTGATYLNKFVELYNPTASPITFTGSVQYRSATGTGNATGITGLNNITVASHDHWLISGNSNAANGAPLPTPDTVGNVAYGGGAAGGTIFLTTSTSLVNPTTDAGLVDRIGYGTSNFPEGTVKASGYDVTHSLTRTNGVDTDANSTDFTTATPTPTAAGPAALSLTNPGPQTSTVGQAISTLQLSASGGTSPYTYGATGLPPGLTLNTSNGQITGTPSTETGSPFAVTVSVTDNASGNDSKNFSWTVDAAPVGATPIADIQGTGTASPMAGQTRTTQGVVIATYPVGGINGFYIQTPGADTTPGASDGLFVFTPTFDDSTLDIGDSVEVTGTVSEFGTAPNTLTEITTGTVTDIASLGTAVANTTVPGSDCALGSCPTTAALNTAKEEFEGELFQPAGDYTVTDAYDGSAYNGSVSSSFFGEIGLAANSTVPLFNVTEVATPDSAAAADRVAYNNAHRLILDDGSSTTYWNTSNTAAGQDDPLPWYTPAHQVRVGADVTFPQGVVLDYRFGWKVQPQGGQVVGVPTGKVTFEQDRPATPADVGGDLKLATFNVLNYFTTLGVDYDAGPGSCSPFVDKDNNPIAVDSCSGNGPRGAWDNTNFLRQQAKIVNAINTMDADIVSLEEIENSRKVDSVDRDEALSALVAALNADAGTTRWDYVHSPATLPDVADEDVIRTGFIYDPSTVDLVGDAEILIGSAAFANAREPFAQAFKLEGAPDSEGFAVVVNHFKSKGGTGTGDNADTGNGAGSFNGDRTRQAQALDTFANSFATSRGVTAAFLTGDFNAYSMETPVTTLTSAGWQNLESTDDPQEESYSFDGASGSLDHVFANPAAQALINGVDIWEINSNETVFNQYSRYNYVGTLLYDDGPFSASDHNPEVVGLNLAPVEPTTRQIQILGTNDFHGRLLNDSGAPTAGAAVLAGAVKQLRGANPDTAFVAAGDLIGASTFESFIQKDKPTIDALNEAGLDVSAAGNHEFDQGYNDLINRVMAPYDENTNPYGGAEWEYIAANVRLNVDNTHALAPTWTQDFGSVKVGYVGAVTEHLPELVSPGGISEIHVTDIVAEVNAAADDLEADGADVIVMLVHEGAPGTACAPMDDDPTSDFGSIITGVDDNIDAIVSGHTHLAYNCEFDVPGWAGRDVTSRPVVSAGQYGMALNQLVFTVDTASGDVTAKSQALLNLKTCQTNCAGTGTPTFSFNYPADPATTTIVNNAVAASNTLGAVELGEIAGPLKRAKFANGTTENRGGESDLGNLVAEVQRWATSTPTAGSAQIAFMNPGGLRDDMLGVDVSESPNPEIPDAYPRPLTYKQAAVVQPFANTLVNMDLTGAQIKATLEQQWQPTGASRPFLKLGISEGFVYTSDPTRPAGSRITGMWLDGTPIGLGTTYSVTVNSFLATGGDNFTALNGGTGKQDTGQTDLEAMVEYMAEFANTAEGDDPLPVPSKQNGVGVAFPAGAPAAYGPGDHVVFNVSGWSFTSPSDPRDTEVVVMSGATTLGTFPLNNTAPSSNPSFDDTGKATVDVVLPNLPQGASELRLVGATTGTEVPVPIEVVKPAASVVADDVSVEYGKVAQIVTTVSGAFGRPTGSVEVFDGTTSLGTATVTRAGTATVKPAAGSLPPGTYTLRAVYSGDTTYRAGEDTLMLTVTKASTTVTAVDVTAAFDKPVPVKVTIVSPKGTTPTGTITLSEGGTEVASATVSGKTRIVAVPAGVLSVGVHTLDVAYSGDALLAAGSTTVQATITKAASTIVATPTPKRPRVGQPASLVVTVSGAGSPATGDVQVSVDGGAPITATLTGGTVTVDLGSFATDGAKAVTVEYLGSDSLEGSTKTINITVRP